MLTSAENRPPEQAALLFSDVPASEREPHTTMAEGMAEKEKNGCEP